MSSLGSAEILPSSEGELDILGLTGEIAARSPGQLFWRRLKSDRVAMASFMFIVLLIFVAIFVFVLVSAGAGFGSTAGPCGLPNQGNWRSVTGPGASLARSLPTVGSGSYPCIDGVALAPARMCAEYNKRRFRASP